MKLSLVVPCYNEAENVAEFQSAVISAFEGCGYDYEIVFVDDGSKDATYHNLKKIHAAQICPVKVISFSRNFGKEAGIYAGLQHASGEYISLIDADLQQRPEIVRDMVRMLSRQQGKEGPELSDWINRFCNRKWNSEFSREMSRSCTEMVKDWLER